MVNLLVYVALGASLLGVSSFAVLARYFPVLRRASTAYVDSSDVISSMMKELNARASLQDRRLADVQVKLDVLENRVLRAGWSAFQAPATYLVPTTSAVPNLRESEIGMSRQRSELSRSVDKLKGSDVFMSQSGLRTPSNIEILVLKSLVSRRMTAPEIKSVLGSSREHAARMMKSLADKGLVVRDSSKRPYSYVLSDIGRDVVTDSTLPSL